MRGNAEFYAKHADGYQKALDIVAHARRVYEAMDVEVGQSSGVNETSIKRLGNAVAELEAGGLAASHTDR